MKGRIASTWQGFVPDNVPIRRHWMSQEVGTNRQNQWEENARPVESPETDLNFVLRSCGRSATIRSLAKRNHDVIDGILGRQIAKTAS
jgi:hypothetical protein